LQDRAESEGIGVETGAGADHQRAPRGADHPPEGSRREAPVRTGHREGARATRPRPDQEATTKPARTQGGTEQQPGQRVGSDPEEEGAGEEVRSAGDGDVDSADRLEAGAQANRGPPGGHPGGAREQHFGQLGQVNEAFTGCSV
jgi:hypothetical protein